MQSTQLFWPSDRKLFRQQSRLRSMAPVFAVLLVVLLGAAFAHAGWR